MPNRVPLSRRDLSHLHLPRRVVEKAISACQSALLQRWVLLETDLGVTAEPGTLSDGDSASTLELIPSPTLSWRKKAWITLNSESHLLFFRTIWIWEMRTMMMKRYSDALELVVFVFAVLSRAIMCRTVNTNEMFIFSFEQRCVCGIYIVNLLIQP